MTPRNFSSDLRINIFSDWKIKKICTLFPVLYFFYFSFNLSVTHAHQLLDNEWGLSVASIQLANDSNTYYCIGTAMVYHEEFESSQGRIILFQLLEGLTDQVIF